jgi:hypothetical protein
LIRRWCCNVNIELSKVAMWVSHFSTLFNFNSIVTVLREFKRLKGEMSLIPI